MVFCISFTALCVFLFQFLIYSLSPKYLSPLFLSLRSLFSLPRTCTFTRAHKNIRMHTTLVLFSTFKLTYLSHLSVEYLTSVVALNLSSLSPLYIDYITGVLQPCRTYPRSGGGERLLLYVFSSFLFLFLLVISVKIH